MASSPESRPPDDPDRPRDDPDRPRDNPDRPRSAPPPGSAEEALRRIEERLDRASEAAERLIAQAAAEAAGGGMLGGPGTRRGGPGARRGGSGDPGETGGDAGAGDPPKPPPGGWQVPEDAPPELDPFVALVQAVRELIPPELQRRLVAALREFLLALRALIDWYLERLERRREEAVDVQDIPIL